MKIIITAFFCLVLAGCGPSEDDLRSIVRDELGRAGARSAMTNAQVIGPYSPAVRVGNLLFVSGQVGLDHQTGKLTGNSIEEQTHQALTNLKTILGHAGLDSSHVVQCSVFLKDMNDFQRMNLVYGGHFSEGQYPSRTTVEVSNLPRQAIIEISAIAYKSTQP